jgi:hypothetical protein
MLLDMFGLAGVRQQETDTARGWNVLDRDSGTLSMDARISDVYNERAFHYFLAIERRRASLSRRPLFLLLVDLATDPSATPAMERNVADRVFDALSSCLRDTDFVGWYRDGRVAGGVLTQDSGPEAMDVGECVMGRVRAALASRLPDMNDVAHVRVFRLPANA